LLAELEATGWKAFKATALQQPPQGGAMKVQDLAWPGLRRKWLYRGREWRIRISDEDCQRLARVGRGGAEQDEGAWCEAIGGVIRAWYEDDATLAPEILHDPDGIWFVSAWVACRVWAGTEEYASFLLERVVGPALFDVKAAPTLPLLLNPDQSTASPRMAMIQEGYTGLLETIAGTIHKVTEGYLQTYWRVAVKNYFRDRLKSEEVRRRGVMSLEAPMSEKPKSPTIMTRLTASDPQLAELETMAEGIHQLETLAALESKEWLERLQTLLTPQQRRIVSLHLDGLDNAEVATRLNRSTSTVEKERRKIREIAAQLGIGPG
jgi:RNA polymerase sigma factor (sigma-70 family)